MARLLNRKKLQWPPTWFWKGRRGKDLVSRVDGSDGSKVGLIGVSSICGIMSFDAVGGKGVEKEKQIDKSF
jgi:hypothetical protein